MSLQCWTSEDVPENYEYGKSFLPWHIMEDLPRQMRVMHEWYMKASGKGFGFINVKVSENAFISGPNGMLVIDFKDLYILFKLDKMGIDLVTAFCLLSSLQFLM